MNLKTQMEYLQKCRNMWLWIRDHTGKDKADYLLKMGITEDEFPTNHCYLCQYWQDTVDRFDPSIHCASCLVQWTVADDKDLRTEEPEHFRACCENDDSPYFKWTESFAEGDYDAACRYAGQVVHLCNLAIVGINKKIRRAA
jgi:hypothetical protein